MELRPLRFISKSAQEQIRSNKSNLRARLQTFPPAIRVCRHRRRDAVRGRAGVALLQGDRSLDLLLAGQLVPEPAAPVVRRPLRDLLERARAGRGGQRGPSRPGSGPLAPGPVPPGCLDHRLSAHAEGHPQRRQGGLRDGDVPVLGTAGFDHQRRDAGGFSSGRRFLPHTRVETVSQCAGLERCGVSDLLLVGGVLSMASYNRFDVRDTVIVTMGKLPLQLLCGICYIFRPGPHGVEEVRDWRSRLTRPEALALLPGSAFWSVLFSLMLFALGIDTLVRRPRPTSVRLFRQLPFCAVCARQFGNIEGITAAVLDEFPQLRGNAKRESFFLAVLSLCFYLTGLLLLTDVGCLSFFLSFELTNAWGRRCAPTVSSSQGGMYWFTLVDSFSTSFGLIIITLFMSRPVLPGHRGHDPALPSVVQQSFGVLQSVLAALHSFPSFVPSSVHTEARSNLKCLLYCGKCCEKMPLDVTMSVRRSRYLVFGNPAHHNCMGVIALPQNHSTAELPAEDLFTVTLTDMDFSAVTWEERRDGARKKQHC
ncbi:uncharacterized protein LOC133491668 isoform X2 [Syngnathoides biaculeatus]|uniref:uncharacterized protein LOC133491668 isoform X2 n=1 Tax=Syngnathoides biaculeatus TaxID=300417 RepID=UPI002ADDE686|nr:uncharacterized protein LOC133491668 isoform X2 [Syngnathoides biaculeatus]XP_061659082.1 uncharacterized protein LOC133491668 isoform X2 [Syngnathoides biaculeatus]XP_061659083.1 uncharacterized protein LOC133491668 isoform X2 [Syngnathoides biaculeatus]XP_061659084.1 uncharacterized protein LOC133491668 isoform X2 [Syngnathoides biaculeatus]XP_061659085.1 uncharacterized protein LOC133491668 isoform X2 [Syngnathoides biaculeatus]